MKCPYANPTIQQCENCTLPDCVREITEDHNNYQSNWCKNNPDKRRAIRYRYYKSHAEKEHTYNRERYQKIKNTPKCKAKQREYYLNQKAKPGFREKKKEQNKQYREKTRERQAG
jgi:hypothetical protein